MIDIILCALVICLSLGYIYWRLANTNTDIRSQDEYVPYGYSWDGSPGIGHNGGPPINEWDD